MFRFSKMKTLLAILTISVCFNIAYANPQKSAATKPIIGEYFGIWGSDDHWNNKFRDDTPFKKLNRLYVAFGQVVQKDDGHFTLAFGGPKTHAEDLVQIMQRENPNADVFLTIGGTDDSNSLGGAANDSKFAQNVVNFLQKYGFNGLDIDWENDLDKADLDKLVENLHTAFKTDHLKLTLAVWPFVDPAYDMPVLSKNLDQINIMSYGTGLTVQGCASDFLAAGFPLNKMIGGIETESGYDQFGGVTDTLGSRGTIASKSNYVLTNGLAGMMSWRMDNDHDSSSDPGYPTYKGALQLWKSMNAKSK